VKLDKYTLNARAYPAALCVVPIILLVVAIDDPTISKLLSEVIAVQVIGQIGIGVAAFFLLMQLARTIGHAQLVKTYSNELYSKMNCISRQLSI